MAQKKLRVLLIEDDSGKANLLQEILGEPEENPFDLKWVACLQPGLARLDEGQVDLILLNISLPDGCGLERLIRLRSQYPTIPIVVLSDLDDEVVAMKAIQAGAQDHLVKGEVDNQLLVRSMRYAVDSKRWEIELQNAHQTVEMRVAERTLSLSKANEKLRHEVAERKEAEDGLQDYVDRLQMLHRIDQAIHATQSPQAVAQAALNQLQHLIPCQYISVFLYDLENAIAIPLAQLGQGPLKPDSPAKRDSVLLKVSDIPTDIKQGNVYEIWDLNAAAPLIPTYRALREQGIRAFVAVPLCSRGELVGVLNLGKERPGYFDGVQIEIAAEVANQIALAIQQASLYAQIQEHANQLESNIEQLQHAQNAEREQRELAEALRKIGVALSSTLDFDDLLDALLDQIDQVVPFDAANIMLVENTYIRIARARGYEKFDFDILGELTATTLNIETTTNLRQMAETGQAMVIPDTNQFSDWMQLAASPFLRSWAGAPIKAQGQVIAFFSLDKIEPNFYCTKHAEHLAAFAGQASVAFENAQLFKQAEQEIAERMRIEETLEEERSLLAQRVEERTMALSQANAELARAVRLKDEFLASMSHELRTPLNAILGFGDLLQNETYGQITKDQDNALQIIERSARHLLDLINDILDVSKIEAGKLSLEISPISVETVCQVSLDFVKQIALQKQINISVTYDKAVSIILADERRLKQILVNLLHNAVKFTPEKGSIGLDVIGDKPGQTIRFVVWDTGIGIADNDMKRLFQPFTQLDSSLSRQHPGTGLGLTLVSLLTEIHGGQVNIDSTLGQGSRFTVSLPWKDLTEEIWYSKPEEKPDPGTFLPIGSADKQPAKTILLAEDNIDNVALINRYLRSKGYEVTVARNGAEAIQHIQETDFDLVLMDIQMPVIGGFEVIRHIRALSQLQKATLPIIALTAKAMPGDREQCLAVGANNYLSKPLDLRQLLSMINVYVTSPKS